MPVVSDQRSVPDAERREGEGGDGAARDAAWGTDQGGVDGSYRLVWEEIKEVARAVRAGGMVLWRSAVRKPWYSALFVKHGLEVEAVRVRVPVSGDSIDRVNMYTSCYRGIKL